MIVVRGSKPNLFAFIKIVFKFFFDDNLLIPSNALESRETFKLTDCIRLFAIRIRGRIAEASSGYQTKGFLFTAIASAQ